MTIITIVTAAIAIAGVAVTLVALVWLHTKPTGLHPVTDAVSRYGISPYREGYRVATLALGIAGIALAVSLLGDLTPPNILATVFMLIFAGARLLISWSPMDLAGMTRTSAGRLHNVLATLFFASVTVAAFLYSASFAAAGALHPLETFSSVLAWAMAVFSVGILVTSVASSLKPYFGLVERALYVAVFAWMIGVSVGVLVLV